VAEDLTTDLPIPPEVTIADVFVHLKRPLELRLLAGEDGFDRKIRSTRIQKPGLALVGHTSFVHKDRLQFLGETEISFLQALEDEPRRRAIQGLVELEIAALIVTKGLDVPAELVALCEERAIPLFTTPIASSEAIHKTTTYLDDLLSPRCSLHGVLVDVNGVGVLIIGASGIGKSECALDLVERGHRLVADDVVEIRRRNEDLVGQASDLIRHLIEVRGLGVLNIAELYGVAATRDHKRIELVVELEPWSPRAAYDRLGLEERNLTILGLEVRSLLLPVSPGRNVAGIVEVAARNFLLQRRGHHAGEELSRRIQKAMEKAGHATDHIEDEVE
jgi:HPr kinase/phosphorylase